jgi:glycosyltransferase involved in cell wall biosynthesis
MKPLVSILIPAHNAGEWLSETLRCAVEQTWERKEIILVDDGSTDHTLAIARRFESAAVRVFTQPNGGAAAARNKAFSLCSGDYIQWLDADDLLSPDKIALQMEMAERSPSKRILFSSGWGQFLCRSSRTQFSPTPLWCDLSPVEFLVRKLEHNLHMQTATWLVSRELTEAAGPWDTRLLGDDDGEYFCRVLLQSDAVQFVSGAKVYYRASGTGSLSYIAGSPAKIEAQWRSMQMHIGYVRSLEDSSRVRQACLRYMQTWLINFYPERADLIEEMQKAASELGGNLDVPRLSWKYSWIATLFGWRPAKRVQRLLPALRWGVVRFFDRTIDACSPGAKTTGSGGLWHYRT